MSDKKTSNGPKWGSDGLNHRYCSDGICTADGTTRSAGSGCPAYGGGRGHDCNYA